MGDAVLAYLATTDDISNERLFDRNNIEQTHTRALVFLFRLLYAHWRPHDSNNINSFDIDSARVGEIVDEEMCVFIIVPQGRMLSSLL